MQEYNYKDIKEINSKGIVLRDGCIIFFEECRCEWAKAKGIDIKDTSCVAERDYLGEVPYFLFYTKERVKIYFQVALFFKRRRAKSLYDKMRILINRYGYSSYDMT